MLPPLYAILDVQYARSRGLAPLDLVDIWLGAGVRLVQLRAKELATGPLVELADAIGTRVRGAGGTFVVNDRADVARMVSADGVHVGQDDLSPRAVRALVGSTALVGLSTHTERQVAEACREPVSYIAIGPVFATQSKAAGNQPVGLTGVRRAAELAGAAGLPVVAIGGISLDRARDVLSAGASAVAVISDLLAGEPAQRARQFIEALGRDPLLHL